MGNEGPRSVSHAARRLQRSLKGARHWENEAGTNLHMISKLISVLLLTSSVWAQSAADTQKLQDAKIQGFALPSDMAARSNVRVEAVLLPPAVSKALFGKAISSRYAVIELTISNKSQDAAFIVHSVFIDDSEWLLSGTTKAMAAAGLAVEAGAAPQSVTANQIASVEYRIARGEALDAQAWTARNWAMRLLQFLGVLATGSEFTFKETGIVKGIGAFTGQVVPAAQVLWPDGTAGQLDRISDFGFRANKVIPKEASDIVIAFFPLDRFLTPGLKKLFLASPAVFFVPAAALVDKTVRGRMIGVLQRLVGAVQVRPDDSVEAILSNSKIKGLLDSISLSKIRVEVDGILSVDIDTVPARIDSVTFDAPTTPWDGAHPITGVLHGAFLSDGQPEIDESKQLGITVEAAPDQASGNQLRFTLHLSKAVATGTILHFHVTKTNASRTIASPPFSITVPASSK
jgi:hypothetical protein